MSTFTKRKVKKGITIKVMNIDSITNELFSWLRREKLAGIKRGKYFTHINQQINMCMDTLDEYNEQLSTYERQGIYRYKSIPVSLENLNEIGAKSGEIIVFKTTDDRVMWDGEHPDKTGLAFDYMGAKNELVIVDIKF
jgi:hypothetical protein|nr:hypothetical protein [uncultured Flavobacterium sp.]